MTPLQPVVNRIQAGRLGLRTGRLRLKMRLARDVFASANPLLDDFSLQLGNANLRLACVTFPRERWKRVRAGYRFRDPSGTRSAGITSALLRVPKSGPLVLDLKSARMNLLTFLADDLRTTIAVGGRCTDGVAPLRQQGKGLVFP